MILAREKSLNERLQLALRHRDRNYPGLGLGEACEAVAKCPVSDEHATDLLRRLAGGEGEFRGIVSAILSR